MLHKNIAEYLQMWKCFFRTKDIYKIIFYTVSIISILLFCFFLIITRGDVFVHFVQPNSDSPFLDFFSSVRDASSRQPYDNKVVYPAMANLVFYIFSRFNSEEKMDMFFWENINEMRLDRNSMLSLLAYLFLITASIIIGIIILKKGTAIEKSVFVLISFFTAPMIFGYERANITVWTMALCLIFIGLYRNPNPVLKEIGFLSLALAASIKIFPAIFGLLLIKEKRIREAIRLIIYGIFSFFLPFALFGGMDGFVKMIRNLTSLSLRMTYLSTDNHHQLQFQVSLERLLGDMPYTVLITKIFLVFIIVSTILSLFYLKEHWKFVLLLTCVLIGIPSVSVMYVGTFMIIPLILFLDTEKKKSVLNFIYLFLMMGSILIIPFIYLIPFPHDYAFYHVMPMLKIESFSILLIALLICVEVLINFYKQMQKRCFSIIGIVGILMLSTIGGAVLYQGQEICTFKGIENDQGTTAITLTTGETLSQVFKSKRESLHSIRVRFLNTNDECDNTLNISVRNYETGKIIYNTSMDTKLLKNARYAVIYFGDLNIEKNVYYQVDFNLENNIEEQSFGIYSDSNPDADGHAMKGSIHSNKNLAIYVFQ